MTDGTLQWFKTETREGKTSVFDPLRKRFVALTPEEEVRQKVLYLLVEQLHVPSGAKLVCYTDGLVERTDGNAVLYDTNLVERCISTGGSIANILAMIAKERGVDDHPEDIFDDISMLGFEFK